MECLVLGEKQFSCRKFSLGYIWECSYNEGLGLRRKTVLLCRKCLLGYMWECSYYGKLGPRLKTLLQFRCHLGYIREWHYYGRLDPRRKHFCYAGIITWAISGNAHITKACS